MFGPDELKKRIENTLNSGNVDIPDGHKIAFVTHFESGSLHTAAAIKLNDEWQVSGDINYIPTTNNWETGVTVRWSR